MPKTSKYKATGFELLSCLETSGMRWQGAAAVAIAKGDALHDDGAGYATNADTAFANTFLGIAGEPVANSGGSQGDLDVPIIPPHQHYQFIVAVEADALITLTARGIIVDLESANTIDISDAVTTGIGFFIDEIDVTAAAIAANTFGYAIGHFRMGQSAIT